MHPRLSPRSPCRRRPDRVSQGGFTLVELLVVITIIAMLVGLLIPAVMRAREAARRATCLNNQGQVGKAIMNYVTAKEKFPPLFSVQPQPTPGPPVVTPPLAVGWVPPMLPYIEQNPLYQTFQANTWYTLSSAEVATLICPSRNPTSTLAPLSYVVNAGTTDWFTSATATTPLMDYQENGIFFDNYAPIRFPSLPKPPRTDLSYVNMHDGTSMTLMVSENVDALDWIGVGPMSVNAPPQPNYNSPPQYVPSWWQSMIWTVVPSPAATWGLTGVPPTGTLLNKNTGSTPQTDDVNARPSSNHPGGFIVTMCDAHSQFMSEDVEYRVYCLLMAPNSQGAKRPSNNGLPFIGNNYYPTGWLSTTTQLKPITEADLNP